MRGAEGVKQKCGGANGEIEKCEEQKRRWRSGNRRGGEEVGIKGEGKKGRWKNVKSRKGGGEVEIEREIEY